MLDRVKKNFCVSLDLMLRSPKPNEIKSNAKCQGQPAKQSATKRNRHRHDLILSRQVGHRGARVVADAQYQAPRVQPKPTLAEHLEEFEGLWSRSNMDAAEYKHVVLGLIFLK